MKHQKGLRQVFRWASLFCLGACLILCLPLLAAAQNAGDEAALRALLERFSAAYRAKDFEGLIALWSKAPTDFEAGKEALKRAFEEQEQLGLKELAVVRLTVNGDRALARISVAAGGAQAQSVTPVNERAKLNRTIHFVKEGGTWKVRRFVASEEELAAELVNSKTAVERQALLEKEKELLTSELVSALLMQARPLFAQGEFAQAMPISQLALDLAEKIGDKPGATLALRVIGSIHGLQGSYKLSLEFYRRSLKLAEETGDKLAIAGVLNNIANILDELGEVSSALEHYQRSLKMATEIQHRGLLTLLQNNIGLIYKSRGDSRLALEYIQRSLKLAEELKDSASVSKALHNIGIIHAAQGNYEQAFEYYRKSLAIEEELGAKASVPKILGNMGLAYDAQGNSALALEYHRQASKRAEEIGDKEVIAGSLNNIGDVYANLGEYDRALEHFSKGLKLAEEIGNNYLIADANGDLAEIYLRLGEPRKAVEYAARSSALYIQAGRQDRLWYSRMLSGKAHLALGEFEPAQQSLSEAVSMVETQRGQVAGGEPARQRFFEKRVGPYYAMVELLLARRDDFQALAYSERAKGRVLLDVLNNGRVNINKAMTPEEQAQEHQLDDDVSALNSQIFRETSQPKPDPARLKELDARLQKARLAYESFQTDLYAAHPELKLRRGQALSLTREQLASLVPDARTALLEFVVGEDASYLFLLTRGAGQRGAPSLKTYRLNIKAKELTERVADIRRRLSERNLDFREPARRLYNLLLGPASHQLRGKTLLCIVPDGVLWELPFQALQPRDDAYLIEDSALFYTPSLSVLHGMENLSNKSSGIAPSVKRVGAQAMTRKAGGSRSTAAAVQQSQEPLLLAFGNPALGQRTIELVKSLYRDERLGPLPEAEREVKALGEFYTPSRSRVYIGEQAREERAKAEMGNYRILHFATHGVLDTLNPMYSHLLLSEAGAGAGEDGLLHAWEVMNLNLRADIVVLSACETARGRLGAGEGVIGMGWALFVAGSPTTVLSLWKVESASTAELMVKFHRHLMAPGVGRRARQKKAEALRAANLELMKDARFRHPFYWAGFVMIGNGM